MTEEVHDITTAPRKPFYANRKVQAGAALAVIGGTLFLISRKVNLAPVDVVVEAKKA